MGVYLQQKGYYKGVYKTFGKKKIGFRIYKVYIGYMTLGAKVTLGAKPKKSKRLNKKKKLN